MAEKNLRLPPQDLEAEESVLGSLMLDKEAITAVADLLAPNDFYKKAHEIIYERILNLWDDREPIDILSVSAALKKSGQLKETGGVGYLTELVNSVPSAFHISHYAKIVKEKSVLRSLINASAHITEEALTSKEDIEKLLDDVEQRIFAISQRSIAKNFIHIGEGLKEAYERIERVHRGEGGLRGVPTGFIQLDNILSGLQPSDLIVIGARPSFGKTAFALDIARHIAVDLKKPVGIFSLEMSRPQVEDRLIAAEAQVDLWKLRTGRLKDEVEFEMLAAAADRLRPAPLYIDDSPSPNIVEMRSMARRLQAELGDLSLIVVDYLQLIEPRRTTDSMVQQVTEISRGLKGLARELAVPIIAVSQLSRAVEQRGIKRPQLADLRESGAIEQDADVVMFLYPRSQDTSMDAPPVDDNTVEIIVAKHRNGPLGTVRLFFDKQRVSFQNLEETYAGAEADQAIR
ncbi:MAG: replicative DNA helicase [Candidatus Colwellbacteria bacterium]|nr:replicative DNA helicase [Candidatus Colwellbacteria bacterium]